MLSQTAHFDSLAENYERHAGRFNKYFILRKCEILLQLVATHLAPVSLLKGFDAACGNGFAETILSSRFLSLTGLDASSNMIKEARKRRIANAKFVCGEVTRTPFKNEAFDFSFSFSLMHHLPSSAESYLQALGEISRVTKRGGLVATFDHNALNPATKLIVARCAIDVGVERLLTLRETETYYKRLGLEILEKGSMIFLPHGPMDKLATSLLSRLGSLGGQFFIIGRVC